MEEWVLVWEIHHGSDAHHKQVRRKTFVLLQQLLMLVGFDRTDRRVAVGTEPNHSIGKIGGAHSGFTRKFHLSGDASLLRPRYGQNRHNREKQQPLQKTTPMFRLT